MPADHRSTPQKEYTLDLSQSTRPITPDRIQSGSAAAQDEAIAFTNYYVIQNGHPCIPIMGEFHASRFPRQYWRDELQKMRAGGVTIVASYIFWIHVEEEDSIFDWSGDRDIHAFIEACQGSGLQVLLRIGPFAHGECRNGGLPDWLYGRAIPVRSNDEQYLFYVRRYFAEIANQVKGLLYKEGGPVVGIQIENEYMHAGAPWEVTFKQGLEWVPAGSDGTEHIQILKRLAIEAGLEVPCYSCTGWGGSPVPDHGFFPMQSAYAFTPWILDPEFQQEPTREFLFRDRHSQSMADEELTYDLTRYPYAYCEMGGGIQITHNHRPVVPPECVQAMAIVALGSGTNWLGYYMYHGGSNPVGKHSYLNEFAVPRISYDFQAPIREYGQLNQSYHYLRALHLFLHEFGETLAPMAVALPEDSEQITAENTSSLRYAARSKDGSGFLFLNNYQDHVAMQDQEGVHLCLELPGESLVMPQGEGLILRKNISAILPFNLRLDSDVLLKYATAQILTKLSTLEQTTYVFFAPDGMRTEFSLDRSTYRSIEVSEGALKEDRERDYIMVEPGLQCRLDITTLHGTHLQLLVLTQEQAHTCWKVWLWGQERLILSESLVLCQDSDLHLYWHGQESTLLSVYPSLPDDVIFPGGLLAESTDGFFSHYRLSVPEQNIALSIQRSSSDTIRIGIPAASLDGVHDALLSIDYLGDTGNAYLDGHLVSDHFANGSPWEIGLKRFMIPGINRELIVRISPLQQQATTLRYFPSDRAVQPASDGTIQVEVYSITIVPEYHIVFTHGR